MKTFDIKQHPTYNLLFGALQALRLKLADELADGKDVIDNSAAQTRLGSTYQLVKIGADFPLEPRATVTEACTELLDAALKDGKHRFAVPLATGQSPCLVWRMLPEVIWGVYSPDVSPHIPKDMVRIGLYMSAIVEAR